MCARGGGRGYRAGRQIGAHARGIPAVEWSFASNAGIYPAKPREASDASLYQHMFMGTYEASLSTLNELIQVERGWGVSGVIKRARECVTA